MTPSRYKPYEPERIWERFDIEKSQELLNAFAEFYVIHLEYKLDEVVGHAEVELAKQPQPAPSPIQATGPTKSPDIEPSKQPEQSTEIEATPDKPKASRRESRKKKTRAMYKSWQKAFQNYKKSHPEKSDTWYSIQIARLPIARNSSSETIRKHMKP
jgi:hypothetical protein